MTLQPIDGPSVWRGRELVGRPEWTERLDAGEVGELETAVRDGTVESLPALDGACGRWRDTLEHGSGVVRICGLDTDGRTDDELAAMFATLADRLGTRVSQTVGGELMFRVEDAGLADNDARARGPNSRRALTFHSDRCDVIGFLCVRTAHEGGDNLVVSAGAIHNEILRTRPELAEALYRPFWWQRHTIDGANRHPHYAMPVFAVEDGRFAVTLMQVLIDRAHRSADVPDLTATQREALELVQALAADPAFHVRFRQRPGEILLLNNYVTLHSRTEFTDPPGSSGRLLLRVWVSVSNNRPLPASWAPHYGAVEAGAVRGGIRTGGR